jgi:hypothetical protein
MIDLFLGPQSSPRTMEALRRRYQQPPPRSHFGLLGLLIAMGWDYSGSVLSCNATLASHERHEAVRETYLAWKEKLKGKSD